MNMSRTLDRQIPLWIKTLRCFVNGGYTNDESDVDQEGFENYLDYLFYVARQIGLPPMDIQEIITDHLDDDDATQVILNRIVEQHQ